MRDLTVRSVAPLDYSSLRPYLLKLGLHFACFL